MPAYPRLVTAIALADDPKYRIAADSGMNPNTLGAILSGRIHPSADQRRRLAATFGIAESDLFASEVSA